MDGKDKSRALSATAAGSRAETSDDWLVRFHRGDRRVLEQCYADYFYAVHTAVGRVVTGVDRETLVHDVFVKLLAEPNTRRSFAGGSFAAWIARVARNLAIDHVRRASRERLAEPKQLEQMIGGHDGHMEQRAEARRLLQRFRSERLRPEWEGVFIARFVEQRTQREAARLLGLGRTTLAWRELRIRKLLREFFLTVERGP